VVGAVAIYLLFFRTTETPVVDTYAVVQTVERGSVSSGIKTSGTIVAAQKLNLDVYKQARRIEAVNVTNAGRVEAGTVLFSFDKSGAYVEVESSRVGVAEAELALATQRASYSDANTTLRTLQNTLVTLRSDIVEAEKDLVEAQRDYYNKNRTAIPGDTATRQQIRPTLSGTYNSTEAGTYRVEVYRSGAESGYSYRVSGLERDTENVIVGIATPVGTRGLTIIFSTMPEHGDIWDISLPNSAVPEYVANREVYESTVSELETLIASKKVEIANTEVSIKTQQQSDTAPYRDLDVEKAEAELAKARQSLSEQFDVLQEQDIVAPFAGTVEGLENVVVGATPTGDTNDTISLGTLISDEFMVQFSLSAVDVAKVSVCQKVLVNITSFPMVAPLSATITEVSSLPESDTSSQYEVQALIEKPASSTLALREGLLADIEVVQTEVTDVLRVPLSALSYENGQAFVTVLGGVNEEQQASLDTLGVIKSVGGAFPGYAVAVELGVTGTYFAEIKSGIEAGAQILVTTTDPEADVVEQDRFGPPEEGEEGGGGRPGA
jgi:multidrug efflux pump subunit AcrA (membrane-fusion protein)